MFDIKLIPCLLSVNFFKEEKYVISTNEDIINFPLVELDSLKDMQMQLINKIAHLFDDFDFVKPHLERMKIVSINDTDLANIYHDDKTLYILFGSTLPFVKLKDGAYWTKFDFTDPNIPHHLSIISKVIQHAI